MKKLIATLLLLVACATAQASPAKNQTLQSKVPPICYAAIVNMLFPFWP